MFIYIFSNYQYTYNYYVSVALMSTVIIKQNKNTN